MAARRYNTWQWQGRCFRQSPDVTRSVEGRYAYGLELDGKDWNSPRAFEEPDTHEKGIDNELYRTLGCIRTYRSGVNSNATKGRPAYPGVRLGAAAQRHAGLADLHR